MEFLRIFFSSPPITGQNNARPRAIYIHVHSYPFIATFLYPRRGKDNHCQLLIYKKGVTDLTRMIRRIKNPDLTVPRNKKLVLDLTKPRNKKEL